MKKCLLLLSGGIDSPVAGKLAMQNGFEVLAVHFSTRKITGPESTEKAKILCKKLSIKKLFVVEISNEFAQISKKADHRMYFVLMKRLMLKVAQKIAKQNEADFLVTGENLGQVSSQTLSNLAVIDQATKLPVIRPLLGLDKMQIVGLARKIGTLEISQGKEICDVLGPKHPFTKTELKNVLGAEQSVEPEKLAESALAAMQVHQP